MRKIKTHKAFRLGIDKDKSNDLNPVPRLGLNKNFNDAFTEEELIWVNSKYYPFLGEQISFSKKFPAGRVRNNEKYKDAFGHGDIEDVALTKTTDGLPLFKREEINQIYFGNWLRDFSQLIVPFTVRSHYGKYIKISELLKMPKPIRELIKKRHTKLEHKTLVRIVRILAIREFIYLEKLKEKEEQNKLFGTNEKLGEDFHKYEEEFLKTYEDVTRDVLGIYRPEEHIDNPKRLDDASALGIGFLYEYIEGNTLKKGIKLFYNGETSASLDLDNKIKKFIKDDIEFTTDETKAEKEHLNASSLFAKEATPKLKKDPIEKWVYNKRPSALTYMLEQFRLAAYYGKNKKGFRHFGAGLHVLEDFYAHTNFCELCLIKYDKIDTHPFVIIKDQNLLNELKTRDLEVGDLPLVSGLFDTDDTIASIIPKIADSLFPQKFTEYSPRGKGEITFSEALIKVLLEDRVDRENEILQNAKTNKNELKKLNEILIGYGKYGSIRPSKALQIFNAYLNTVLYLADTMSPKEAETMNEEVRELLKKGYHSVREMTHNLLESVLVHVKMAANELTKTLDDGIPASQRITNKDYGINGNDPTHTQVAKDDPEHHLNNLAGLLAVEAVREVGTIMNDIWEGKTGMNIAYLEEIIKNKYYLHPKDTNWMEELVRNWIKTHPKEVKRAESRDSLEHENKKLIDLYEEYVPFEKN